MEPCEQADDNKYTVGIAASVCLMPLPVIYFVTRPLVSMSHAPWIPSVLSLLFILLPPLTAFITLYCGAWQHDWPRPKRIFLSALLSVIIYGADLVLLCFLALDGVFLGNGLLRGG